MKIKLELKDDSVLAAFNRLLAAGQDLSPVLDNIGEELTNSTKQRFTDAEAPDGTPWKKLQAATINRKIKKGKGQNANRILIESGDLATQIIYQQTGKELRIGSNRIYAGTHQFGAKKGSYGKTKRGTPIPWGKIPPRPFLGISITDQERIEEIIRSHLNSLI